MPRPRFYADTADWFARRGQIGVGDKVVEYNVTQSMPLGDWLQIPELPPCELSCWQSASLRAAFFSPRR